MADDAPHLVALTSLQLQPEGECAFEEPFRLQANFETQTTLLAHQWQVRYVTDTAKRRKIVELGNTAVVDYTPGSHTMEFSLDEFNIEGIPADVLMQRNGLLVLALTGPAGEEPLTVNMVVQVQATPNGWRRVIFNPLE
mmetsp:Transcript_55893/g.103459  ORF Transcript_55893/g.103459 Transcript_55893/m.103459 type:complete len:139 (-) Transcript_55893:75-491(-)